MDYETRVAGPQTPQDRSPEILGDYEGLRALTFEPFVESSISAKDYMFGDLRFEEVERDYRVNTGGLFSIFAKCMCS